MIYELEIGGEVRPVSFGNYAFRRMKNEGGITLPDALKMMGEEDPTVMADLLFYGLLAGRVMSGSTGPQVNYTVEKVAIWMDQQPDLLYTFLPWLKDAIRDVLGRRDDEVPAGEGDAEPKKRKTKAVDSTGQ